MKNEEKKAEAGLVASDEDREGEAMSWHLYEVYGLKPENTKRIVFLKLFQERYITCDRDAERYQYRFGERAASPSYLRPYRGFRAIPHSLA